MDGPVLDLDDPDPAAAVGRERVRLGAVRAPLWLVLLVAVGVAVGAVATTRARDAHAVRGEQLAAVRIVVSIHPDLSDRDVVSVVNAGPLPIQVAALSASLEGVRINGTGRAVRVPAGTGAEVDFGTGLVCRRWSHAQPFELDFDVRTADGRHHPKVASLSAQEIPWFQKLETKCSPDV